LELGISTHREPAVEKDPIRIEALSNGVFVFAITLLVLG
jgi:hypothetical protein